MPYNLKPMIPALLPVTLITLLLTGLLLAACGDATTSSAPTPTTAPTATTAPTPTPTPPPATTVLNGVANVKIIEQGEGNYRFVPDTLTIKAGTVVIWTNTSDASHNVMSKAGAPGSFSTTGMLTENQTFAVVFTTPGTYSYQCSIHPTTMQGTITVTA